jgi:SAM-dependent methyltransferase
MVSPEYYDKLVNQLERWRRKNRYYHSDLSRLVAFLLPPWASVLEIGCGTGDLLSRQKAGRRVGIDFSAEMIKQAKTKHPEIEFLIANAEKLPAVGKFDYILLIDLIGSLSDIQKSFSELHKVSHEKSRIIITFHNYLWEPVFSLLEDIGLKEKPPLQNWLSRSDVLNLLNLTGFEELKSGRRMLFPRNLPVVAWFFNSVLARMPILSRLCITNYIVARPAPVSRRSYSVSVVVPARNEKGNIEELVKRMPVFPGQSEIIFVEGHSKDATWLEIQRVADKCKDRKIVFSRQKGIGKGDAVRAGFQLATGEILMILDADMTVPPEDLLKFYFALADGRGELINGCRLVYPMEKQAMRFLNSLANKFFAVAFSAILSQPVKDTLCGTKVLLKSDYELIARNRGYFGDFDPFGDFDLLLGAAKLNLKIVDLPIRYRERTYGATQIQRFRHGWLLLKMSVFAARKMKFNS